MNWENPDLYAYVLGELSSQEAAKIRLQLQKNPHLLAELQKIEILTQSLRISAPQPSESLTLEQRQALLQKITPKLQPQARPHGWNFPVRSCLQVAAVIILVIGSYIMGRLTATPNLNLQNNSIDPHSTLSTASENAKSNAIQISSITPPKTPESTANFNHNHTTQNKINPAPISSPVSIPSIKTATTTLVSQSKAGDDPILFCSANLNSFIPKVLTQLEAKPIIPYNSAFNQSSHSFIETTTAIPKIKMGHTGDSNHQFKLVINLHSLNNKKKKDSNIKSKILASSNKQTKPLPKEEIIDPNLIITKQSCQTFKAPWNPKKRIVRLDFYIPTSQPLLAIPQSTVDLIIDFDPLYIKDYRKLSQFYYPPKADSQIGRAVVWIEYIVTPYLSQNQNMTSKTIGKCQLLKSCFHTSLSHKEIVKPMLIQDQLSSSYNRESDSNLDLAILGYSLLVRGTESVQGLNIQKIEEILNINDSENQSEDKKQFLNTLEQTKELIGIY